MESGSDSVKVWVRVLRGCGEGIAELDEKIQRVLAIHPDTGLFASFPGSDRRCRGYRTERTHQNRPHAPACSTC
jgi:hypothetical protein